MNPYGWRNFLGDLVFVAVVVGVVVAFFAHDGFINVNDIQAYPY